MTHRIIFTVLLFPLGLIVGCNGGNDANNASNQPAPAAPLASKPKAANIPGGTNIVNKKPTKAPRSAPKRTKSAAITDPDTFFIEKEAPAGEKFEIITGQPKPSAENLFAMVPPQEKQNSESFTIVERPEEQVGVPSSNFQLPEGFTVIQEYGYSPNGIPNRIRCEKDQAIMAFVPGGLFLQGTDEGATNASPQHTVDVSPFFIDVTEVTLASYKTYIALSKNIKGRQPEKPLNIDELDETLPARGLDWGQAKRYAKVHDKDLPTEAEWEKAARGVNGFQYPWGNSRPIWSALRNQKDISPVQAFKNDISPFGVYDMAGNTKEWCLDWYAPNAFESIVKSNRTASDPEGPKAANSQREKVLRGNGPGWRITHREGKAMSTRDPMIGFRCVLRVEISE